MHSLNQPLLFSPRTAWYWQPTASLTTLAMGILIFSAGAYFFNELSLTVSYSILGLGTFFILGGLIHFVIQSCRKKTSQEPEIVQNHSQGQSTLDVSKGTHISLRQKNDPILEGGLNDSMNERVTSPANIPDILARMRAEGIEKTWIYGAEAWACWGVQIVEEIPPLPEEIEETRRDPFFNTTVKRTHVWVYFPGEIIFKGKKQQLTLNVLREVMSHPPDDIQFSELKPPNFSPPELESIFDLPSKPGWVLMRRWALPYCEDAEKDTYMAHLTSIENAGYQMPTPLEAIVRLFLPHMIFAQHLNSRNKNSLSFPTVYCTAEQKKCMVAWVLARDDDEFDLRHHLGAALTRYSFDLLSCPEGIWSGFFPVKRYS